MSLQPWTDRLHPSFLHLLCLFLPRTLRDFGSLCKNPGTSRPWQAMGMVPMSVPNDKVAAAGPSRTWLHPVPGPSSQVPVASSSAGGSQLTAHSLPRH